MKNFRSILHPILLSALLLPPVLSGFSHSAKAQPASPVQAASSSPALPSVLNGIRETRLPNGLTVLTKEVHTAPVVYFSVWFKVGSANEQLGQTGMSHLLEHMLFKGTTTRKPGEISATLQQNGAEFNATTSFDRTNYFATLASDRLELAMQIESDRMVNSLFDPAEHQKEMTVVRSEYEGGENNPGSALTKAVRLTAHQVHPYRWTTIGFRSDIENISRDEMYAYYKKYYVPNNATIVMVGDFDTASALRMVQKYFGRMPRRPIAQRFITPEPEQQGERRVTVRRAGTVRMVQIAHHIPAANHPDRYALDVLESVLSGGRTARFFPALVQSGLASSADAYDYGLRDADLVFLDATAQPGKSNAELEKALLAEVEKLKTTPISDEELKRVLNQAEAQYIYGKDSVQSQGRQLGENAMRGDWRYGETYLQNLRRVTAADVQRVAQKYFVERNRTVGYFEPIAGGTAAPASVVASAPAAPSTAAFAAAAPSSASATNASSTRQTTSARVAVQQNSVAATGSVQRLAVKPTRVVLDNGLTVIIQENHANPTVAVSGALLSAGGVFDPANKPGLANYTASQLSRGTRTRSLLDIARTLENVGASAGVGGGREYVSLNGRSLTRDFDTVLDVLADQLRNPVFPAEELEKARRQALAGIEQARQSTGTLARIAFMNALYPEGHPYHMPTLDEQETVLKSLTREDLVAFHAAHYAPDRLVLTVVGDVNAPQAIAAAKKYFGDWQKKGNLPPVSIPDTNVSTTALAQTIINVPDKAQADVLYGYAGNLKRSDPDFYRVVVMNTILGGGTGLASRLATNVRDRLGLVYGIYASTDATLGAGPFSVQFGANPQNVDKAVAEMQRLISVARGQGFTRAEVQNAIAYITGSYAVTLATNSAVAGQLLVGEVYGLGLDYIQKRNRLYQAVTVEQVNEAAKKYLRPGQGTLVVAGTYKGSAGS
ncbi:MAG TPA: pitrilysin family protein [Abditibacteriaceae bacterium]|jgi:zinc protease